METVRLGSTGADVELLQLTLTRAGFSPGAIDGVFGAATRRALVQYQQSAGIPADGIAGPQTWNSLVKYIQGYTTRQLVRGDTLFRIANTYNTTVRAITGANPGLNANNLRIGQTIIVPFGFPVVPTNISYSFHLTTFVINGLLARYPFIRTTVIGRSVMGKNITAMIIGNGPVEVSYNASHHANEWITTPVVLRYLEEYAAAYRDGGTIFNTPASTLYNRTTLYLIPLVNPDGVDLVNGIIRSGPYYRTAVQISEDYPDIPFPDGWKANISGTDLNLQYPAGWELAKEIKFAQGFTSPAPRDFVGTAALSAPESRAMHQFTSNHNFSLILAYHTQGEIIYWKYLDYLPPRSQEIALKMGDASGYTVEETPYASGHAGYKDWFIQQYNRPGYTIECGRGENPLPISQFDQIYSDNVGIMTLGMTEA
ncbi:MAG: peptidoglycan-binding protein [Oscillospiraceae bacterium]|jgi:g-D-glutamyl-meso-diaminopimelate peptidase|nr:peptidoglycan-binding protein [Oscillospiraceae bacterium]